jgi:hypothetical protein
MDPEIAVFVEQAASVAASGRWDAVNDAVKQWAARPKIEDEIWYGELFADLCFRVFYEYSGLKEVYAAPPPKDDLALLSWRARNLLELSVWATFCAKDRDNARQSFEDLGRDASNLLKAFETWGEATNQSPDWFQPGMDARDGLANAALVRGVASIDGKFTDVADAAGEIGIANHFRLMNKLLSKFAHPTAMLILGNSETRKMQKDSVFANGCLFFVGAFTALENISKGGV